MQSSLAFAEAGTTTLRLDLYRAPKEDAPLVSTGTGAAGAAATGLPERHRGPIAPFAFEAGLLGVGSLAEAEERVRASAFSFVSRRRLRRS